MDGPLRPKLPAMAVVIRAALGLAFVEGHEAAHGRLEAGGVALAPLGDEVGRGGVATLLAGEHSS